MKKRIRSIFILSLCAIIGSSAFADKASAEESLPRPDMKAHKVHAEPLSSRILLIGIDKNPPVSIPVSENKALGFYPEILEEIAKKERWNIKYIPCSGRQCCGMLDAGEVDAVIGSPWSRKRTELYDFSATGIINNWGQIIGRREDDTTKNIATPHDLKGLTIAGVEKDTQLEKLRDLLFDENVDANIIEFQDYSQVVLAVAGKAVDVGVVNRFYAVKAKKTWYNLQQSNMVINATPLGIATKKGHEKEMQSRIDYWITRFKKDPDSIYHKAYKHWLGDLDKPPVSRWLYISAGVVSISFLFGAIHLFVLRRQVKKRTSALSQEVQARIDAEAKLVDEKTTLEGFFNSLPGRAFVVDPGGNLLRWNKYYCEVGGWDNSSLSNSRFVDHIAPEDKAKAQQALDRLFSGDVAEGKIIAECTTITKDGNRIPMLCAALVQSNAEPRVIGIGVDISSQKQAETSYTEIFNAVSDALLVFDHDGNLLDANTQASTMFGFSKADLMDIGAKAFCSGSLPYTSAAWLTHLRVEYEKESPKVIDWAIVGKDRNQINLEVALRIACIGGEKRIVCSFRDVTERKQLEDFIAQQKKMDCVGLFASGVAHDFNNVLSPMLVYGQLLKEESAPDSLSQGYAVQLLEAGKLAKKLASDLVGLFRKDSGSATCFNLNQQVLTLLPFLQKTVGKDIEMSINLNPDPCYVMGFVSRTEQILLNFAVNSRDAIESSANTNKGKIVVATRLVDITEADQSKYGTIEPGKYVMLSFADNGCGMTETVKNRIFEPFYTTKPPGHGTGLGMATVYNAIHTNRGGIHIISKPERGTTIEIVLPQCLDENCRD
ncbi:PAS domain S-box protein (plasmid) [Trichlorobacter lovleyi]|uniref:PAS domain S-box protein n=1 Tax=Trichlorobacter lovleyi TaxID=313985 RepID=UPI00223EEE0D|nr:transporter substrate-binding domain-containing protein [Trichlorobacter lovleyi]QOX80847.1 PAS domain S-box protein [Trichlorobacter lovleyi]